MQDAVGMVVLFEHVESIYIPQDILHAARFIRVGAARTFYTNCDIQPTGSKIDTT